MWAKPENKAHAQELLKREVKKFSQERAEPQRSPISNQTANSETSLYDFGETDDSITSEYQKMNLWVFSIIMPFQM